MCEGLRVPKFTRGVPYPGKGSVSRTDPMARERKPSAKALEAAQNAQEQEDEPDEPKVRGPKGKKRVAAEADEYQPEEESAKDDDEYEPEAASKKTTI